MATFIQNVGEYLGKELMALTREWVQQHKRMHLGYDIYKTVVLYAWML